MTASKLASLQSLDKLIVKNDYLVVGTSTIEMIIGCMGFDFNGVPLLQLKIFQSQKL